MPARPRTGIGFLPDTHGNLLHRLFTGDDHVDVETTWVFCQYVIGARCHRDRVAGPRELTALFESLRPEVPAALIEVG